MSSKLPPLRRAESLKQLRDCLLAEAWDISMFQYQRKPADAIIDSFCRRDGERFFVEMSRQSGKSELVCDTAITLAVFNWLVTKEPIAIGTFAPTTERTKPIFDRIRTRLRHPILQEAGLFSEINNYNSVRLVMQKGRQKFITATITAITAEPHTIIKGSTLDLILCDETQDIVDRKIKEDINPMGAATNATRVYIGTPSRGCLNRYFFDGVMAGGPNVFIADWKEAAKYNALYAAHVKKVIEEIGEDDDEFLSQYCLHWAMEVGRPFVEIEKLGKPYERMREAEGRPVIACIDVAKEPDSTVVTIIEQDAGDLVRVLDWLELRGTNYDEQIEVILEYLSHFDVQHVIVDSVGVGDPVKDMLTRGLRCGMTAHKWTAASHHTAFTDLLRHYKSGKVEFPAGDATRKTREYRRFINQFQELEKEYKGNLMRCQHRDSKDAHDDYCSSLALYFTRKGIVKILPSLPM